MITVEGLSKAYKGRLAIDDVSFVVSPGRVTGFVGPDGAGKSSTIRVMVGLSPATKGCVTFGGHRYADLPNPGLFVGVHLHSHGLRNPPPGRRALAISARTMGLPMTRVDDVLELVLLTPRDATLGSNRISQDVRQRLRIAHALLGDPMILILDQPQDGMEPAGRQWIQELLTTHATHGGTVLISSNALDEVDAIADDLVVIAHGRIVAQGSKQELLATRGSYVQAAEHASLIDALGRAGIQTIRAGDGLRSDAEPARVGQVAAAAGLNLIELRPTRPGALQDLLPGRPADTQPEGRHKPW